MSRRDLIRMTDDEVTEFLGGRRTMNVATQGPDGRIHLVAMWYGFTSDGRAAFETYRASQKVLNLRRDPRITCLVETGSVYEELRGVELVGSATVTEDRDQLVEIARSVADRYFDFGGEPAALDAVVQNLVNKRVAVIIDVDEVVSWDHRKLGGTY